MTVINEVRPGATARRRRHLLWACIAAAVLAALIAGPISNWYVDHPHGNPDPNGSRIAFLSHAARAAVPPTAVDTHLSVKGYSWEAGGCDGGNPGWGRGVVNVTFRRATPPEVDSSMAQAGWRVGPWLGGVRDYIPSHGNPYDADATLFDQQGIWTLNFSASPAEVPTHSC
jgi:hypothetical protein